MDINHRVARPELSGAEPFFCFFCLGIFDANDRLENDLQLRLFGNRKKKFLF